MRSKLIFLTSCLFLFSSCTQAKETTISESELATEVAATIYAQQATSTSTHTKTTTTIPLQATSVEPIATEMPISNLATSTMEYAREGTPFPTMTTIISPENAHELVPLARWGKGAINRLTFSDDSEELILATTLGVYFLNPKDLSIYDFLELSPGVVEAAYLEDEAIVGLLIGYDLFGYEIQVWDRVNHKLLGVFASDQEVQHLRYSEAEGELLTVGYAAEWWDPVNGETRDWQPLMDGTYETILSHSGNLLGRIERAAGLGSDRDEDRVFLCTVIDGETILELKVTAQAIAISDDDEKLALSSRNHLRIYDIASGTILNELTTDSYTYDLTISSDGSVLAYKDEEGNLWMWETTQPSAELILEIPGIVTRMTFSPNNNDLALIIDQSDLQLIQLPEGDVLQGDDVFSIEPVDLTFLPETEQIISLSLDGELILRDLHDGSFQSKHNLPRPYRAAFTPGGQTLAIWDDVGSHISVWDSEDGTLRGELNLTEARLGLGEHPNIEALAFTQTGEELALGTYDGKVGIWHHPSGSFNLLYQGNDQEAVSMAISPQEDWLALGGEDGLIRLLSLPGGHETDVLAGQAGRITDLAFSPDGEILASASLDGTVVLWRMKDKDKLDIFDHTQAMEEEEGLWGDRFPVSGIALSPDGKLLVSWSTIGSDLWLWDIENASLISVIHDLSQDWSISSVSFSEDGLLLAVGLGNGTIQVWGIYNR